VDRGAVDIPYKVHKYLGVLGAKLYFLRLPDSDKDEDDYLEQIDTDDFIFKTKIIEIALIDYLDWFEKCPEPLETKENDIAKIKWNFEKDDKETKRFIVKLGMLLAHLRGVVPTWETRDSQGVDYAYTFATIEDPERAIHQLRNLARGHALSQGRNYITINDLSLVIQVVFSTASKERVTIFDLLLNFGGELTTKQIVDYLRTSANTAKRTMAELKAIGLVAMEEIQGEHGGEPQKKMILDDKFYWFISDEFRNLKANSHRKNFDPLLLNDNEDSISTLEKECNGGIFSYGGKFYSKNILHNSVLPRTLV
jgi:hypothetical protein